MADESDPLVITSNWVTRVVIGLGLCPFAKAVQTAGQVRYRLCTADSEDALLLELKSELTHLQHASPELVDTTLLVHPHVLQDFRDYNDFLDRADEQLLELGLEGELQIASFHPDYCFAGSAPDDVDNCTNRSPYPMLHLLREASVSRAVDSFPDTASIYERNIATLRALGADAVQRLLRSSAKV